MGAEVCFASIVSGGKRVKVCSKLGSTLEASESPSLSHPMSERRNFIKNVSTAKMRSKKLLQLGVLVNCIPLRKGFGRAGIPECTLNWIKGETCRLGD